MEVITAIVIVAGGLFLVMLLGLAMIAIAVWREDRARPLAAVAPDLLSRKRAD